MKGLKDFMHIHATEWHFRTRSSVELSLRNGNHVPLSFVLQQQEQDPTNLYLSNLPVSMDEQELENLLKPFGQVISTRILRDAHGMSRGVGFARSVCVFIAPPGLLFRSLVSIFLPVCCVNTFFFSLSPSPLCICLRMESTEKCDAVISHFNGKFIKSTSGMLGN